MSLHMIKNLLLGALIAAALTTGHVMAAEQETIDKLRARLNSLVPELEPSGIEPTPIEGVYEVRYGAEVLYLSADGRYLLRGSLVDLQEHQDLTETTRKEARVDLLSKLDEKQMIVFSPEHPKHTITVFTDIDCAYCRKLHSEINQYLAQGIKVRYLAFPRTGVDSPSFEKAVDVWCAENRNAAITKAKSDQPVAKRSCENPVEEQMELGKMLGVSGTPAIVLENGEMIPGYQPAKPLGEMLDLLPEKDVATANQ
jgi:thiol:disulfide interchange protein DsbC